MHSLDHHQKYHNTAVTHKVGGRGLYAGGGGQFQDEVPFSTAFKFSKEVHEKRLIKEPI